MVGWLVDVRLLSLTFMDTSATDRNPEPGDNPFFLRKTPKRSLDARNYRQLSWIRTKGDVSVACVFDVAQIVNFVVIEHKMFLSGILVL